MPEDAGKKKYIQDFLQDISDGEGFIEDIWIERNIRSPGSSGEGSTALSLSGRTITNITGLLEDDLKHSFHDGYFTFRIITAIKGSGKTSLLTYLNELIKANSSYQQKFVISRFRITDMLQLNGDIDFSKKLYCHILSETFLSLVNNSDSYVKEKTKEILKEYFQPDDVARLVSAKNLQNFRSKFIESFCKISIVPQELLFDIMDEVLQINPHYVFTYLIDELDGLEHHQIERQQTLSVIRSLLKGVKSRFGKKIRLFIYLVGTNENVKDLFREDPVIEDLIAEKVVDLNTGYQSEFEMIKKKINDRIEGAFKGYKNFDDAWLEIGQISLTPGLTLRSFCKGYSRAVLEIYQKYFTEAPEQRFEGIARDLVQAQCRGYWKDYLARNAYRLSPVSTTKILGNHAFDCYVELLHNGFPVARCFGEAKNYELLKSHLDTFDQWLQDVKFKGSASDNMSDLAFMIAPSCPGLLKRKLELKNIHFIQFDKVIAESLTGTTGTIENTQLTLNNISLNLNTADSTTIKSLLRGTGIKGQTKFTDALIQFRPFEDLADLSVKVALSSKAKSLLETKLSNKEICF